MGPSGESHSNDAQTADGVIDLSEAVGTKTPDSVVPRDVPDSAPADDQSASASVAEPEVLPFVNPVAPPPSD